MPYRPYRLRTDPIVDPRTLGSTLLVDPRAHHPAVVPLRRVLCLVLVLADARQDGLRLGGLQGGDLVYSVYINATKRLYTSISTTVYQ